MKRIFLNNYGLGSKSLDTLAEQWRICFEQAWEAYCKGSIPIGAAVSNEGGHIIGVGRNRILDSSKEKHSDQVSNHRLAHAEINALLACDFSRENPNKSTLYTTTEPCPLCVGAIIMSNIKQVAFASRDPWSGSSELFHSTDYIKQQAVISIGPDNEVFENILVALQLEFHLGAHENRAQPIIDSWKAIAPQGVNVGIKLHKTKKLRELKLQTIGAFQVYKTIRSLVEL